MIKMDEIKELKEIFNELIGLGSYEGILVPSELVEKLSMIIIHMEIKRDNENKIFRTRIEIIKS